MNRKCEKEGRNSRVKRLVFLLLLFLSALGIVIGIMILYKGKHGGNDEEAIDALYAGNYTDTLTFTVEIG